MSATSTIEWTEATWNPVRGCDKVSPGCKHCYASTFAERFRGVPGHAYEQGFDVRTAPDQLRIPLSWRKPRKVFVNSMSDLFHKDFSNEYIAAVFGVMAVCRRHTFQVLTKRAERMEEWFKWAASFDRDDHGSTGPLRAIWEALCESDAFEEGDFPDNEEGPNVGAEWPLPNVWAGVSVENQDYAWRLNHLVKVPAAVRFVSAEPLLGPLDISSWLKCPHGSPSTCNQCAANRKWNTAAGYPKLAAECGAQIHWVITGAESGHGARAMDDDWVRRLRNQCADAGTKFFFKQRAVNGRKISLPILDGVQHAAFPTPA